MKNTRRTFENPCLTQVRITSKRLPVRLCMMALVLLALSAFAFTPAAHAAPAHPLVPNIAPLAEPDFVGGYSWTDQGSKNVVYVDTNLHVERMWVVSGGIWQRIDLTATYGFPSAAASAHPVTGFTIKASLKHVQEILYVDGNNHIEEITIALSGQVTVADLTKASTDPHKPVGSAAALAGYSWSDGTSYAQYVLFVDNQSPSHVEELYRSNIAGVDSFWHYLDLTQASGATAPGQMPAGQTITGYSWHDGSTPTQHVFYITSGGDIGEFFLDLAQRSQWQYKGLRTFVKSAPAPWSSTLSAYVYADTREEINYVSQNSASLNHVIEIYGQTAANNWHMLDLTNAAGGVPAVPPSGQFNIAAYQWSYLVGVTLHGYRQVVYQTTANNIEELYVAGAGTTWQAASLTGITGAPLAVNPGKHSIAGYTWYDSNLAETLKQVVYITQAGHIEELYVVPLGHWQAADLSART